MLLLRRSWFPSGRSIGGLACCLFLLTTASVPARAETEVDLALVLAVDISYSMDPEEQQLQREGFVRAFRSQEVQSAIRRGMIGRIGVTYVEWAGSYEQRVVLPWTLIDGPEAAVAFAASLSQQPARRAARTSISGVIDFSAKLLAASEFVSTRQVIDISGDGPNNHGRPVTEARDEVIARGITINGLPLMLKGNGVFDIADLADYYRRCVIGGAGAFLVPVRDREQFINAVKTKIVMEIAARPPAEPAPLRFGGGLVSPVQAPAAECLIGEMRWKERMGG